MVIGSPMGSTYGRASVTSGVSAFRRRFTSGDAENRAKKRDANSASLLCAPASVACELFTLSGGDAL